MFLLEKLFLFTCCVEWTKVTSQVRTSVTTFAYTETATSIDCPIQQAFTTVNWKGPPGNIPYYDPGLGQFNPSLGEKFNRLSLAENQSMILSGTKLSDDGLYTCVTAIGSVVYQGDNTIQVRTKAESPSITPMQEGSEVFATEDKSLTLQCISRGGNPAPMVVLYKGSINGQVLRSTSTVTQVGDTFTVTLNYTFTPSRVDDRQQLVCRSYWPSTPNAMDSKQTSITLYLYLKPLQLTFPQPVRVVSGDTVTARCTTTGSRPAADISWVYRGQTYTPSGTITEDKSSQTFTVASVLQKTVTAADNGHSVQCKVTHRALTSTLSESNTLIVQYPPEITVYVTNASIKDLSATITCSPSGFPDQYIYLEWIHTWDGQIVSRHQNTPVLTLTKMSYEQSGVYICRATNGIDGYQQGFGMLLVESFPVVIHPDQDFVVVAEIGGNVNINVSFYTNNAEAYIRCYRKLNKSDHGVGSIHLKPTEVYLPVYNYTVISAGTTANIVLTVNTTDDYGEYHIMVSNSIGSTKLAFTVTEGESPGTPQMLHTDVMSFKSVNVSWLTGYHGGLDQTFVIQTSTDQQSWMKSFVPGGQGTPHSILFYVLDGLAPDTLYHIRMFSQNKKGRSSFTKTTNFTTEMKDAVECTSTDCQTSLVTIIGSVVGGALGGFILCVLLHQIVFRVSSRRITRSRNGTSKSTGEGKESAQVELGAQSSESTIEGPVNSYETLTTDHSAHPYADLTPTTTGQANAYEMLGTDAQPTHMYTELKSAQKDTTAMPSDGKVYLNVSLK